MKDTPGLLDRPAKQAARALERLITMLMRTVRLTSRFISRPRAACQANWPIPATSRIISRGMATLSAMLTLTPASASNCGSSV